MAVEMCSLWDATYILSFIPSFQLPVLMDAVADLPFFNFSFALSFTELEDTGTVSSSRLLPPATKNFCIACASFFPTHPFHWRDSDPVLPTVPR